MFRSPSGKTNVEGSDEKLQGVDEISTRRNLFTENDRMSKAECRDVEETTLSH